MKKYEVNVVGHNTSTSTGIGSEWQTTLSIDVTNSIFAFVIRKKDGTDITKDEIHDVNLVTSFKQLTDMVSVKMPVLRTIGKNLFDVNKFYKDLLTEIENGEYSLPLSNTSQIQNVNIMDFLDNSQDYILTISAKTSDTYKPLIIRVDNKYSNFGSLEYTTKTLSVPKGTKVLRMVSGSGGASDWFIKHTQIEVGSAPASFEDHKSNILSTPSDLILRGIGDVQDTLDLMTGEVTKHIYEIIFDESFKDREVLVEEFENVYRFGVNATHIRENLSNDYVMKSICDRFSLDTNYTGDYEHCYYWGAIFYFFISKKQTSRYF